MIPTLTSAPSVLIGANPRGATQRISLAVRNIFDPLNLTAADALVLACSGGADSLALSLATADHAQRRGIACLSVTVNHGIRPESADEASAVAALLSSWGVRSRVYHAHDLGDGAQGPEGQARNLRRTAFALMSQELQRRGFARVFFLLGHTADDQAETVLLRLARGSGVSSLRAMSPISKDVVGTIVRPLLAIRRSDTHAMCQEMGLVPVEDPTNALDGSWRCQDGSALRRSAIRHQALPELANTLGVDPIYALTRTAMLAADDDDALEYYARLAYEDCLTEDGGKGVNLRVEALEQLPRAVRRRVIRRVALECGARGGDLSERHLNRVNALIENWKGQGRVQLPGVDIFRKGHLIYVIPR